MTGNKLVFVGIIVSSTPQQNLSILNGYLTVENGKITRRGPSEEYDRLSGSGSFNGFQVLKLSQDQFLIPGFVDCHTHAPQFPNIGLGLDRPLLEWLEKYTFPLENMYKDVTFSSKVYDKVVQRLLVNGTTTACYFGSLHVDGTLELAKSAIKHHQRALVGKVSMNIKNDAGYYNDTEKELADTDTFVSTVLSYKNDLVQPIVTPRFAVSCDGQLMTGLAQIADKYKCRIQSHISENLKEIELVRSMFPDCKSYGDVYSKCGLLTDRTIMAHGVHLEEDEIKEMVKQGTSLAHCPASNTRLKSGLCPVKKLLNDDVIVGLGTDVSGGDQSTILDSIRRAMDVATSLEIEKDKSLGLDWKEAFYLATLGGAKALKLDDKIGTLEIGKEFDALLIDVFAAGGQIDHYDWSPSSTHEEHAVSLMERFIYLGDDRNITKVYVQGENVKCNAVEIKRNYCKSKCVIS